MLMASSHKALPAFTIDRFHMISLPKHYFPAYGLVA